MSTNKQKLFETLEDQRGAFVKIAFIYFFVVIIGFGLVMASQTVLDGLLVMILALAFLASITVIFLFVARGLYQPLEEITKQVETLFAGILNDALSEEGN